MTYRRTIRDWCEKHRERLQDAFSMALALLLMAGASFVGAWAAFWVFGP